MSLLASIETNLTGHIACLIGARYVSLLADSTLHPRADDADVHQSPRGQVFNLPFRNAGSNLPYAVRWRNAFSTWSVNSCTTRVKSGAVASCRLELMGRRGISTLSGRLFIFLGVKLAPNEFLPSRRIGTGSSFLTPRWKLVVVLTRASSSDRGNSLVCPGVK